MDVTLALSGLVLLSPILVGVAAAIRLGSPGPILYRARRVGRGGRPFSMWKFRTMVVDADRIGGPSTSNDDPRVTVVGRRLRTYKLDELPQLLNVVAGDMSLVGPRPEVQQYVDLMTAEERQILDVRPGITDWATLWNPDEGAVLAGSRDPERAYLEQIRPEKIRWQLEYVRRRSFLVDLSILARTIAGLFVRRTPRAFDALNAGRHPRSL
jgi:lipopolysaccharide/colanic/teichoic acid biosynthesis glycosyltransferase